MKINIKINLFIIFIMEFYMYKSICPGWIYGNYVDIKHMVVPENSQESEVKKKAKERSNAIYGVNNCNVELLQKFHMTIKPIKSYSALTTLTFHGNATIKSREIGLE